MESFDFFCACAMAAASRSVGLSSVVPLMSFTVAKRQLPHLLGRASRANMDDSQPQLHKPAEVAQDVDKSAEVEKRAQTVADTAVFKAALEMERLYAREWEAHCEACACNVGIKVLDSDMNIISLRNLTYMQRYDLCWAHLPITEGNSEVKLVSDLGLFDLGFDEALEKASTLSDWFFTQELLAYVYSIKVATSGKAKVVVYINDTTDELSLAAIGEQLKYFSNRRWVSMKWTRTAFGEPISLI